MVKVEELTKKVTVLKGKIRETSKQTNKSNLTEVKQLRKSLKRAQRQVRFLTGKKLAVIQSRGKEAQPASQIQTPQPAEQAPKPQAQKPVETPKPTTETAKPTENK